MKVLFTFGGLPHYFNSILNELNKIQHLDIHVAIPQNDHNTIGKGVFQTNEGIEFKVHKLKEFKTYYGKQFFRGFLKLIYDEKPDVLVIIWPYIISFLFRPQIFLILKLLRVKIIFKEIPFQVPRYDKAGEFYFSNKFVDENLDSYIKEKSLFVKVKYKIFPLLLKTYYKMVDATINYIEDAFDIIGSYGVKKEKIFITYNSPDTDSIFEDRIKAENKNPVLPNNKHRLIHVGRLVKWKKVNLLIEAVNNLRTIYNDIELIIVGNGPEEENLKLLTEKLGISDRVKFLGAIYDNVLLGRYMLDSSIYVLAGMGGLSINEAMCYGKPVVCSVCDGTEKHLVIEDYNGKYFEEDNIADLSNKIDQMFSDSEMIKRMGKNSETIIRDKINVNTVINGYLRAFKYVCLGKINLDISNS
jgi:glycosyltransferase involved in cell wall biosynthesis